MSDNASTSATSLWRETLSEFQIMIKQQWKVLIAYIAITSVIYFFLLYNVDLQIASGETAPKVWKSNPMAFAAEALLRLPINFFASYVFVIWQLRRFDLLKPAPLGADHFVYWLDTQGKQLALLIIISLPLLTTFLFPIYVTMPLLVVLPLILGCLVYVAIRLLLVSPISALQKKSPLQNSWDITEGRFWRIFWFPFIVGVSSHVLDYIKVWLTKPLGTSSIIAHITWSIFRGLSAATVVSLLALYACTVYRVLTHEERQNITSQ